MLLLETRTEIRHSVPEIPYKPYQISVVVRDSGDFKLKLKSTFPFVKPPNTQPRENKRNLKLKIALCPTD